MTNKEAEFLARIQTHKGILFKISKMYMDHRDDQDDLFQEIICQLWKVYDTFRGDAQFSTWMYRVAVNTAIAYFKKEKKQPARYDLPSDNIGEPESDAELKEQQLAHFYRALQKLDKIEKALVFYHLEGYSHAEIGRNIGISEGNARVKLSRAKTKLKDIIERQGYEF
ncbi:RNA polymerase sigma factor [Flavobacterium caeni]|uniref:RNA polymerase sigma-70 factor, ECF subfamily n=1 Tax=Flavobacterium caeni TaxID=490189 RepID=A0A1G5EB46_9FLAO|nr:RNA polymerase sigma factor [Flavobacterium caeni]SCY24243.1 RNA polymerase sigma-70 factor, ECF subfamily [Flavobacterium caeni]